MTQHRSTGGNLSEEEMKRLAEFQGMNGAPNFDHMLRWEQHKSLRGVYGATTMLLLALTLLVVVIVLKIGEVL